MRFRLVWLAALVVVVGFALLVVYGVGSKPATGRTALHLHLPNLQNVLDRGTACNTNAYPAGAAYRFEFCAHATSPVGWRPCSHVTYTVDPADAPPGYRSDVQQGVTLLAAATGLHLVAVPSGPNISIAWDSSLYDPAPGTSGEAGVTEYRTAGGLSGTHATSAAIRLSSHLRAGSAPGVGEEPVLLHELGHAVGLGHFDGPVVMNPVGRAFAVYQPGDLAGLGAIYRPASCPTG